MALKFEITGDNSNLLHSLDGARNGVHKAARDIEQSGLGIEDMFKRIGAAAGIAFSLNEAKAFIGKVVEMRSFFQDIESSMKVFLGNEEKALAFTNKLKDYAYYNMFEFKDLAAASQQMIAYGHAIDDIIPRLDQLSNVAVGTHGDLMELVSAYNKAKSTGVVDAHGLQSWAVKGIVIKDVLKEMGEEVTNTTVTFEQLNKVLDHVTGEGGMFHDLQLSMMENISAEIGQFEDNFNAMLNEIGEKYQDYIIKGIKAGSELVDNYETIAKAIQDIVVALGIYKAAMVVANTLDKARTAGLFALTTAEKLHYGALVMEEKAQKLLNATILKNPYVLAAMAVGTLAYGIYKLATATSGAELAEKSLASTLDNLKEKQSEYNKETQEAITNAQNDAAASKLRKEGMDKLISRYPDIIQKYIDEKGHLRDILQLKKEIAEYDGKRQREEVTEELRKSGLDAWNKYNELKRIYNQTFSKNGLSATDKASLEEIKKNFKELTGESGSLSKMMEFYKTRASQGRTAYNRNLTENKIYDFTKEGGTLEGYTDAQLKALQTKLRNFQTDDKKKTSVFISELDDYLTYNDRQDLLTRVNGMLASRADKTGAEETYASAKENFEKQKKTLDTIQKNMKAGVTTYVKKVGDSWEIVAKGTEGAIVAEKEQYDEIKKAADEAEKSYKGYGGDTTGKGAKEKLKREKQQQEFLELTEEQKKERDRAIKDMEFSTRQAEIAQMKEGVQKELAQIQLDFDKQKEAIARAYEDLKDKKIEEAKKLWEANPSNEGKLFDESSVNTEYTEEEIKNRQEQDKANEAEYNRHLKNIADADRAYRLEFLKEYGTYEEQRLAISEEYDRKIAEAANEWQKKSLAEQKRQAMDEVEMAEIKFQIDWGYVFSKLTSYSTQELEKQKRLLESLAGSGKIEDINQIKELQDAISAITEELSSRFGGVYAIRNAYRELRTESGKVIEAEVKLNRARATGSSESVKAAEKELTLARERKKSSEKSLDAAKKSTADFINTIANFDFTSFSGIFKGIQGVAPTFDSFFGTNINGIFQSMGDELVDALANLGDKTVGLIGMIAKLFSGERDNTIKEELEVLDALRQSVDNLAKDIEEGSIDDALKAYETQIEMLNSQTEIGQKTLADAMAKDVWHCSKYCSDNDHSAINKYLNGRLTQDDWNAINKLLGTQLNDVTQLWGLTPEDLYLIQTYLPSTIAKLKSAIEDASDTEDGGKDAKEAERAFEYYLSLANKKEEYERTLVERLTKMSLGELKDNFASALEDMKKEAKDFSEDVSEILARAIMNMELSKEGGVNDLLEAWYQELGSLLANKGKISSSEFENGITDLREEYERIAALGRERQEYANRIAGVSSDKYEQEASSKGFQAMGQDTADELNGRFTALQIAGENIAVQAIAIYEQMIAMTAIHTSSNTALLEIRNLMITNNSYLDDVAKYSKKIYNDFATKMDEMITEIKRI